MCKVAAVSAFIILVLSAFLPLGDFASIPYSRGAAVVVGIGAVLASGVHALGQRIAIALGIVGLLGFRIVSGLLPGTFDTGHGQVSGVDGFFLGTLMLLSLVLAVIGFRDKSPKTPVEE